MLACFSCTSRFVNILRIIHGRAWVWSFSSSVQLNISPEGAANEWDVELNTRREIRYLQAKMFYFVYYFNTTDHNWQEHSIVTKKFGFIAWLIDYTKQLHNTYQKIIIYLFVCLFFAIKLSQWRTYVVLFSPKKLSRTTKSLGHLHYFCSCGAREPPIRQRYFWNILSYYHTSQKYWLEVKHTFTWTRHSTTL